MDLDLDRPVNDDVMEYEEAEPSTGIPIEADGTIEEVLKDDEVMDVNTGIAEGGDTIIGDPDGDVDLEVEEGGEGEGDMEPEPTPIPGPETSNPFFGDTAPGIQEIEEIAEEVGAPEEMQPEAVQEGLGVLDETSLEKTEGAEEIQDTQNPLIHGSVDNAQDGVKETEGVATGSSSSSATITSSTIPTEAKPTAAPSEQPGDNPAPETADDVPNEDEGAEHAGDDEEYYEDAEVDTVPPEEVEPSSHTASEADPTPHPIADEDEDEIQPEEDIPAEDDPYDPDEMLTINTLPAVILHLPDQPPKSLFFPLDGDEKLPDGISTSTPVWFEDKVEELAQVPMDKLLEVIRREIEGDGKSVREGKEMILEEKGLGLRLGEHDKNLSRVSLLEYLQVHHSCDLPTPVQFFVTFQQSRFWDRFDAIRKELVALAERRTLTAAEQTGGEGDLEEGNLSGDEEEEADGYVTDEDPEEGADTVREARRPSEDDARARYGGSQDGDARREKRRGGEESAHPNADWARNLPTGPMAFGIGEKASPFPRSRDSPQRTLTPLDDEPVSTPQAHKGRSSAKPEVGDHADTTEASDTDSRQPKMNGVVPLDEIALKEAHEAAEDKRRMGEQDEVATTSYDHEVEEYDDDEAEGEEVIDDAEVIGKDALEMKKEDDALNARLDTADTALPDDEGIDLTFDQQRARDEAGEFPRVIDTAESTLNSATDIPLGDVEVAKMKGEVPASTTSVLDSSLAASSITDGTSGTISPVPGTPTEGGSRERSSLANEVFPDETVDDTVPTTIAEEDEDEYEDEAEDEEDGGEDFTVDADKIVAYSDEKAAESEAGDEPKQALKMAVDEGLLPKEVAEEEVGQEVWEEEYEDDDGYVVADEALKTHHGAEPLDDDETYDDDTTISPLGSKRGAEDEDEVTSSKRARFPA